MNILLVLTFLVSFLLLASAINYKKDYCDNEEYVGNSGHKYPHLHCGKKFLTLSRNKNRHNNLQGHCNKVNEILGNINGYYGNAGNSYAITAVLREYANDDCPTLLDRLLQVLLN